MMIVNAFLLAISLWLGGRLYVKWRDLDRRHSVVTHTGPRVGERLTFPSVSIVSDSGSQIVARNPFSPDRSTVVALPPVTATGPPPQLPVVIGTMKLGSNYEALIAESAQNASTSFKQVKEGAVIGGYRVAEIRDDEVVVELNGERTTINVYLSSSGVARTSTRTGASSEIALPTNAPRVESSAPQSAGGGQVTSAAAPTPAAVQLPSPDPLLKITVEGNRRRYERTTMFGPQIWYEDIK